MNSKIDENFIQAVSKRVQFWIEKKICKEFLSDGVIFRSSTNVEDLPGFNGQKINFKIFFCFVYLFDYFLGLEFMVTLNLKIINKNVFKFKF